MRAGEIDERLVTCFFVAIHVALQLDVDVVAAEGRDQAIRNARGRWAVLVGRAGLAALASIVGRPPWSAAGPLAGSARRQELDSSSRQRVRGDPRGPGGPPRQLL